MKSLYTVILAAGQGKRMRTRLPKVVHRVGGLSLVAHAVLLARRLKAKKTILVVPPDGELIQNSLKRDGIDTASLSFALQPRPLGTGDALKAALAGIPGKSGTVVVINGDMPLMRPASLKALVTMRQKRGAMVGLLSADVVEPGGFGRVLRDEQGRVVDVVEARDATAKEKGTTEVNVGMYVFDLGFAKEFIGRLTPQNKQKEYYVTDLIRLAHEAGKTVVAKTLKNPLEALGVNSQKDLKIVNDVFYELQRDRALEKGVNLTGNEIFIDAGVRLSAGVVLESPCYLKGSTTIEREVTVECGAVIRDSRIGARTVVRSHSYLDNARVGSDCRVGPFTHLRPRSLLKDGVRVGNFVEVKQSTIGEGSKTNHLSYIGDATLGRKVNIGAGTITCNYDGFKKFKTVLEDGVFVGSDTQLVAPVRVGRGAIIAAGTTVTRDVGAENLVISRVPQREIIGWARQRRQKSNSQKNNS